MKPIHAIAAPMALGIVFGALLILVVGAGRPARAQLNAVGSAHMPTFQATASATPSALVSARLGRSSVTIINGGTTAVYLGQDANVTAATGVQLPGVAGASITLAYTGAVYGVTASGSQAVTGYELY